MVLTLLVGLLLTALLRPPADWLHRRGMPRLAATWVVLLGALAVAGAVLTDILGRAASRLQMLGVLARRPRPRAARLTATAAVRRTRV